MRIVIDKICLFLTNKIRKEMPEIDDEKAEVIMYGLQNLIGEVPKIFLVLAISALLRIFRLTLISMVIVGMYRTFSGGVHMKTHIGCIIYTTLLYCGTALIGKYVVLTGMYKYIIAAIVWIFSMIMLKLYAPADTENLPILTKKERKQKQILSYIVLTVEFIIALVIPIPEITSIIIFGDFIQTLQITRFTYRLTNNKYGHEVYENTSQNFA